MWIQIINSIQMTMTKLEYNGSMTKVIADEPTKPIIVVIRLKYLNEGRKLGADVSRHIMQETLIAK